MNGALLFTLIFPFIPKDLLKVLALSCCYRLVMNPYGFEMVLHGTIRRRDARLFALTIFAHDSNFPQVLQNSHARESGQWTS